MVSNRGHLCDSNVIFDARICGDDDDAFGPPPEVRQMYIEVVNWLAHSSISGTRIHKIDSSGGIYILCR